MNLIQTEFGCVNLDKAKNLAVVAGMHGDEISGVTVLQSAKDWLKAENFHVTVIPILNPKGYAQKVRFFDEVDLNHIMPGESQSEAGIHAKLICETLSDVDAVVDLHSARVGQINYPHVRANLADEDTRKLAMSQPFPVVHWPATPTTLRGVLFTKNIPAITVEAGEGLQAMFDLELKELVNAVCQGMNCKPCVFTQRKWVLANDEDDCIVDPGSIVEKNQVISKNGVVSDVRGFVIGVFKNPKSGERLAHIAYDEEQK